MKFLSNIKKRLVPYILSALALGFGIAGLAIYMDSATTASIFVSSYCTDVIVAFIVAIALGAIALVVPFREIMFLGFITYFYTCIRFVTSILELFGGIIYGEETAVMPAQFVEIFVFTAISFIACLVAGILNADRKKSAEKLSLKSECTEVNK